MIIGKALLEIDDNMEVISLEFPNRNWSTLRKCCETLTILCNITLVNKTTE